MPRRYTTKQEPPYKQDSFMSGDLEVRHVRNNEDFKTKVNGVMPGYGGHIPGTKTKYGSTPFGGIPPVGGYVQDVITTGLF